MQVFSSANQLAKNERYAVHVLGRHKGPVETDTGMHVVADLSFTDDVPKGDFVVPGGPAVDEVLRDPEYVDYVRRTAPDHQRTLAICSGSLLLAEAGLLDGKLATTHWVRAGQVRRQFSRVRWDLDRIFTKDENTYCSAGVTSGIDLALSIVSEDFGERFSLEVARELVVFSRRSGGQSQFSKPLQAQFALASPLSGLCEQIASRPTDDWTAERMCEVACLTERSLQRHFKQETQESPSKFVEDIRFDLARSLLESSHLTFGEIAGKAGLRNAQTLRRLFAKRLGITPSKYRERFSRHS